MDASVRTKSTAMRLTPSRRWLVYGVGVGVWASGVLWLLFHYFMVGKTEFGPAPHPLEAWWLMIHAAFGFAVLWVMGLLWGVHIVCGWRIRRHRRSGATLLGLLLLLVATGYLLYYVGGDESRAIISVAHWAIGLLLPAPFLVHFAVRNR